MREGAGRGNSSSCCGRDVGLPAPPGRRSGRPPPAPTERTVQISRTTLVRVGLQRSDSLQLPVWEINQFRLQGSEKAFRDGVVPTITAAAFRQCHYAYFGITGNFRALQEALWAVERYWHKMLCSRSWKGVMGWTAFHQIRTQE